MQVNAIFGPPGTGKTRTLVEIAMREQETARGVLYLSYTRSAADEAVSRIQSSKIKASTLHSFAFQALGMNRSAVVDMKKKAEFARETGIPFQGSERGSDEPQEGDEYATVLEFAHNRIIPPVEAWELFGRPGTLVRFENFVKQYEQWKKTYGYMDYDDMLGHFARAPVVNRSSEVVILDEAQDCTPLQWQAFIKMTEFAKRVYIAGDDDQAIYEWSGANPHGMVEFAEVNEGTIKVLDQSYRVPRHPYDEAMKIVDQMERRVDKQFKPRDADGFVQEVGDIMGMNFLRCDQKGAMIIVRDRFKLREVMRTLNQMALPYDVLGGSSPWTNATAAALRKGDKPEIKPEWARFYKQVFRPELPINIILSTVHQSKGREHETVVVDLVCPTRVLANYHLNPDAERRVWYVALTRARKNLILCGENPIV